jgi:hypothetical protein
VPAGQPAAEAQSQAVAAPVSTVVDVIQPSELPPEHSNHVPEQGGQSAADAQAPGVSSSGRQVAPDTQAQPPLAPSSLPAADLQAPAVQASQQVSPSQAPAVSLPYRQVASTAARVDLEAVRVRERDQPQEPPRGALAEDTLVGRVKQSLRHHRKRKKLEDEPVTEHMMAAHPLLSRYGWCLFLPTMMQQLLLQSLWTLDRNVRVRKALCNSSVVGFDSWRGKARQPAVACSDCDCAMEACIIDISLKQSKIGAKTAVEALAETDFF